MPASRRELSVCEWRIGDPEDREVHHPDWQGGALTVKDEQFDTQLVRAHRRGRAQSVLPPPAVATDRGGGDGALVGQRGHQRHALAGGAALRGDPRCLMRIKARHNARTESRTSRTHVDPT